jgi:RES domain-containing protein
LTLEGWRLADPEFASTSADMLSGEGAFLFGGRWNSKGVRVVYLGSSLAQAAMELLVHLGTPQILNTFYTMPVVFDEAHLSHIDLADLPDTWAEPSMASAIQSVGDIWIVNESSLLLQVPSAAVNGEYNYLLNPLHRDMGEPIIGPIRPFGYDQRLVN